MEKVKLIWAYLLKHWRWSLFGLCIILFACFPGEPFGAVLKGMCAMGFLWISYSIVEHYGESKKPQIPAN